MNLRLRNSGLALTRLASNRWQNRSIHSVWEFARARRLPCAGCIVYDGLFCIAFWFPTSRSLNSVATKTAARPRLGKCPSYHLFTRGSFDYQPVCSQF